MTLFEFKGENEDEVVRHAEQFAAGAKPSKRNLIILGPAPAALAKLRKRFRYHIVVKSTKEHDPSGAQLRMFTARALTLYRQSPVGKKRNVQLVIDVDPVGMM